MKNKFFNSLFILLMTCMIMPVMGQDCMNIYLKNGNSHNIFLREVKELLITRYDSDGILHNDNQFQHIKTALGDIVINVEEIDSITFEKYDEVTAKKNVNNTMTSIMPTLNDCTNLEEAESKIDLIKNVDGVEDVWSDGHMLYVKIKKWGQISFHFKHNTFDNNQIQTESINEINNSINEINNIIRKNVINPNQQSIKFTIANQAHNDEGRSYVINIVDELKRQYSNCNININYNNKPTVDFFQSKIFDNDIVFLITHGGYDRNNVHSLITANELGIVQKVKEDEKRPEYAQYMIDNLDLLQEKYHASNDHIVGTYIEETRGGKDWWVCYAVINEAFFDINNGVANKNFTNKNSLFFNLACMSLEGNDNLANKFINRGLGVYIGYDGTNSIGQDAGKYLFTSMLNGNSLSKAYNSIPEQYCEEWISNDDGTISTLTQIKMVTKPGENYDDLFLTSTYTKKVSPQNANNEFSQNQTVSVEGITTLYDPISSDIIPGFEVSSTEFDVGENPIGSFQRYLINAEFDPVCINSDKGNYQFKAKLPNLEPGKTYHYRAYTYDGKYYNYGEPESFTLNPITITTPKVTSVVVTKASYYPDHYDFNGGKYSFKYNCTVTASINPNGRQIQEWGYVYQDASGSIAKIPLTEFGTSYADSRYSYCLNTSSGTLTFYGYVKYADDPNYYYEEPQQFAIAYPEGSTLNMSECTFKGTETNVSYQGKNYKYKTAYRYVFKPTGAYWLKVGTYEYGSGWNNWTNLPNYTVSPVDANNALTVNYYYDDKTFTGDYNVKLKGDDETHGLNYATPQYVNYTYSGSQFTGCNFHNTSNAQAPNLGPVIVDEEEEVYETVIDIVL